MPVKKHSSKPPTAQAVFHICQDGKTITFSDDPAAAPGLRQHYTCQDMCGDVVRIDRERKHNLNHIWVYLKPTDPCFGCEHREHHRG